MKKFNMKDLNEAKTIVGLEITRDFSAGTLKINQKRYVQDLLEFKRMTSYHPTVFQVKSGSSLFLDQTKDHQQVDLTLYQ